MITVGGNGQAPEWQAVHGNGDAADDYRRNQNKRRLLQGGEPPKL